MKEKILEELKIKVGELKADPIKMSDSLTVRAKKLMEFYDAGIRLIEVLAFGVPVDITKHDKHGRVKMKKGSGD